MEKNENAHHLLILDFGSQFTQLIARRIREIGVYCEVYSHNCTIDSIKDFNPAGIILSGGPESVYGDQSLSAPQGLFLLNIPILGICYGMQLMAQTLGGAVKSSAKHEYGHAEVRARGHTPLLKDIEDRHNEHGHGLLDVWMSHGDQVTKLPPGFVCMASTDSCPLAGMANIKKNLYAIQFHPEVTHTIQGQNVLERFALQICRCDNHWKTSDITADIINNLQQTIKADEHVLLALSGGVDSSVAALLLHRAIGDRLQCVFVNNGLLRLFEEEQVKALFANLLGIKVDFINAEKKFISALKGVEDPEKKRKIIGRSFIEVFEDYAKEKKQISYLAQGTIYPDVIESAGNTNANAKTIKSHHNVGGLPDKLNLKLLEPLRQLFKDEIRKIGAHLGLDKDLLHRHPFPGPGLAVRIIGEVTAEYTDILRRCDAIFIEELHKKNYYEKTSQAFTVFMPIKSVGVVGDARRFGYVVALRAVTTVDFMTAVWAHLPYDLLGYVSNRIINEVPEVARVVYDISGKPPATIEWE